MLDPLNAGDELQPEARARLAEISREAVALQLEAANLIADEAERLTTTREEYEQAREAITLFFTRQMYELMKLEEAAASAPAM